MQFAEKIYLRIILREPVCGFDCRQVRTVTDISFFKVFVGTFGVCWQKADKNVDRL